VLLEFQLYNLLAWRCGQPTDSEYKYTIYDTIIRTAHRKSIIQGCGNVLHNLQTNCRKTT
jgi:hypothetical protein